MNPSQTKSASDVNETQAGAQTGGAQAGAGSAAQQAGTETGRAQAGSGAAYQSAGAETTSDVGQAEAYLLNMKRLVANELNVDAHLNQILAATAQRIASAAGDFDTQVRKLSLDALTLGNQALANAVTLANKVNNDTAEHAKVVASINQSERERTIRNGDVLDVIREAGVSADSTVYQDAIEAAVAKAVAKAAEKQAKA